jgi:hypothetical protein
VRRFGGMIFRNCAWKSSKLSLMPSFRAVATNRSNCCLSVFFGRFFRPALLLPYGHSVISGAVSQPLADNAFDYPRGALVVIYAELRAIAIAEIKLR